MRRLIVARYSVNRTIKERPCSGLEAQAHVISRAFLCLSILRSKRGRGDTLRKSAKNSALLAFFFFCRSAKRGTVPVCVTSWIIGLVINF